MRAADHKKELEGAILDPAERRYCYIFDVIAAIAVAAPEAAGAGLAEVGAGAALGGAEAAGIAAPLTAGIGAEAAGIAAPLTAGVGAEAAGIGAGLGSGALDLGLGGAGITEAFGGGVGGAAGAAAPGAIAPATFGAATPIGEIATPAASTIGGPAAAAPVAPASIGEVSPAVTGNFGGGIGGGAGPTDLATAGNFGGGGSGVGGVGAGAPSNLSTAFSAGAGGGRGPTDLAAAGDFGGGSGTGGAAGASGLDKAISSATGGFLNSKDLGTALSLGGLGMNFLNRNQPLPGQKQVSNAASSLEATAHGQAALGAQLESYLASGTLPPGLAAGVRSATESAKASIRAGYAQRGESGSSAEAQDMQAAEERALTASQQVAINLLSQGASLVGQSVNTESLSAQIYESIMRDALTRDAALGNAIGNFASSLAGTGNTMAKAA